MQTQPIAGSRRLVRRLRVRSYGLVTLPQLPRKKGRVLHLVNSFSDGGTERQAIQLANALHESGDWSVHFASLDGTGPLRDALAPALRAAVMSYPPTRFASWDTLRQLHRFASYVARNGVEIVHTHGFYPNVFGLAGAALAGVPVRIADKRESVALRTQGRAWLERAAFSLASRIVTNSEAVRRELIASGMAAQRICTIHNAITEERVRGLTPSVVSASQPASVRDTYDRLTTEQRCVVMIANFYHHAKDHATLLRAAQRVVAVAPDVQFVLAGEGPLREGVRALVRELTLEAHVQCPGRCVDVAALLARADVCVLSSRSEGLPNVILEYMAAARPVVATDVGGVREAVLDGVTGHLVAAGDDVTMASALLRLLNAPALRRTMGDAAHRRVISDFGLSRQLRAVTTLYLTELSRAATTSR